MNPSLVLASTSPYRKELLLKLGFEFKTMPPAFDEEQHKSNNLKPLELAVTLAKGKALSIDPGSGAVIGSDQLVSFEGKILGKPGTFEKAVAQLQLMSGKTHELITAVAISMGGRLIEFHDVTRVQLRMLSQREIEDYVSLDQPLDCAGAYKMELNGSRLVAKLECQDFTAIQGLPLLQLNHRLRELGWK